MTEANTVDATLRALLADVLREQHAAVQHIAQMTEEDNAAAAKAHGTTLQREALSGKLRETLGRSGFEVGDTWPGRVERKSAGIKNLLQ